ncbi:AEC family transporter [Brucepastera parasyntrophica]|uniref:AEC family transporter n=1 Tax=Brucepastera parasyntrophica TaxID=2880008 RepID=UPI00210CCF8E|nr:AEC family transporter [Brucepastera parasyntrophica]ULQ59868.1 AEC family transporter [Brucepastera parasyntrophica]
MPVLFQILALFILMGVGFVTGKLRILDQGTTKGLSRLIIKTSLPALIFMSFQKPFSRELFGEAMATLLTSGLFYAGIILLSLAAVKLLRVSKEQSGVYAFTLSFSNAAFIGFPVVTSILGEEALFLTAIHNIFFNLLAFSIGIIIIGKGIGQEPQKHSFRALIGKALNINVFASIAGFILFIFSVYIPPFIAMPLNMLGSITTPLAMIVTGAILSEAKLAPILKNWRMYIVSILRLVVWPFLTAVILRLCNVSGDPFYITVIIAGMPAASNASLLAAVYGGDAESASAIVCMTTLLSVVTIPVLAMIL